MMKVGVFCSASNAIDASYFECAATVGKWIGEEGNELVYGGANLGMMECVAQAAKDAGARIIGVVPTKLEQNGKVSTLLDENIPSVNLSDRKDIMTDLSDLLIALPGGVGTLDEIFHVAAAASIGYHSKKIILFNFNGFYDTLLQSLRELSEKGFMRHSPDYYISVANSMEELKEIANI